MLSLPNSSNDLELFVQKMVNNQFVSLPFLWLRSSKFSRKAFLRDIAVSFLFSSPGPGPGSRRTTAQPVFQRLAGRSFSTLAVLLYRFRFLLPSPDRSNRLRSATTTWRAAERAVLIRPNNWPGL